MMINAADKILVCGRRSKDELFLRSCRTCAIIRMFMPLTVGAIRKQRADKRKAGFNSKTRRSASKSLSLARKKPSTQSFSAAFSALDRSAKKGVMHPNKAARLKSRLAKLLMKKK